MRDRRIRLFASLTLAPPALHARMAASGSAKPRANKLKALHLRIFDVAGCDGLNHLARTRVLDETERFLPTGS